MIYKIKNKEEGKKPHTFASIKSSIQSDHNLIVYYNVVYGGGVN